MKIKLDSLTLSLLAALGLASACAVQPSIDGGEGGSSSGDGDGDGDGNTETETGEPPEPYVCEGAQAILQAGTELPSGFVRCSDGFVHRTEALEAADPQGADSPECADGTQGGCSTAADCVAEPHGRCLYSDASGCACSYGCATDADCNEGAACAPAGVFGPHARCIAADCRTDADCGDGLCGLSVYEGCCVNSYALACASPLEECHTDAECTQEPCAPHDPNSELVMYQCAIQSEDNFEKGQWTCKPPGWCGCDCGRPYFIDGEARVAPQVARADWCLDGDLDVQPVDPETARVLAEHWAGVGQFEHASVASFARFAMQLMQLGAPPQLLKDTAAALTDEIEHARLTFALASAYAGRNIGPGPLAVAHAATPASVREIVEGLIVEACVGETLAAIEAREAALWAEDPVVAGVLETIADDEWRHAQLGWRALAWMLGRGDASLRSFARACFEAAIAAVEAGGVADQVDGLRHCGVLDDRLQAQLRAAGLRDVIRPCAAALHVTAVSLPAASQQGGFANQA